MSSYRSSIGALIVGIVLTIGGALDLITGGGGHVSARWGKVSSVDWAGLIIFPIGIIMIVMSIIAIRRGKGKPKYTEEDVVKAKAALDRMYFREHGRWPEEEEKEGKKGA